jgi:hypothetical protein
MAKGAAVLRGPRANVQIIGSLFGQIARMHLSLMALMVCRDSSIRAETRNVR